jgi:multiple sugar transport system ATP-binding protein
LREGEALDTRREALYDRPANVFVAGFIGSPAMTLVRGRLERAGDGLALA